jgi:hypothetical protein
LDIYIGKIFALRLSNDLDITPTKYVKFATDGLILLFVHFLEFQDKVFTYTANTRISRQKNDCIVLNTLLTEYINELPTRKVRGVRTVRRISNY